MKIEDLLKKKGIEIIFNGGYFYRCKYKNKEIIISSNTQSYQFNHNYSLTIDGKKIFTKGHITTCIARILREV